MDQIDRIGVLQAARLVDTELSEHQKGQIHAILTAKTPEKFVTLFSDANHFRPLLVSQIERASDGPPESSTSVQELHVNPTMKTIPPRKAFESVLKEFSNGGLKVAPIIGLSPTDTTAAVFPPPARSDAFGTPDARWRLFTDITHNDILATKNKVFDSRELLYNDHETAWKLFRVIVQDYGDILDASHSNIDWISVSREMGRPYEIDPQFTAYIYTIYYTYVAPIVAFWLWEVYIVMKQQLVASTFAQRWEINLKTFSEPAPSIAEEIPSSAQPSLELPSRISLHSSHKRKPHDTVMHAIHSSFSELNKELYSPLTQEQLDELPLYDPLSYVHKVAVNQKLRAVIRHLPQEPVELLCNVVQWVLDTSQDYFEERRNIIKLLQDLSHALPVGKLPKNLENPFQNPERPWKDGGEAYVIRQKSGEHWFAIRVHKYASMERSEVYLTDKRIKRSIILQRQFHHKNLLETFGISYVDHKPAIVMPYMDYNLQEYQLQNDPERGCLIRDISDALIYLHNHHQVHGDLHWANVLVKKRPATASAVLADFGMSRIVFGGQNSTSTDAYWSQMVPFMPEEIRRVIDAKRRAAAGDDDGDMDDEAPEPEDVEIRPDSSTDIFSFAVLIIALTASAVGEEVGSLDKKGNLKLRAEVNRLRRSSPQRRLAYRGVQNDALFMQLICNMLSDTKAVRPSIEEVQGHLPQAIIMPISE